MALTDISRVTGAINALISQVVLSRDTLADALEVRASPPEDEGGTGPNIVSVHLFHVAEDPHRKNLPPLQQVRSSVPVRFSRMGIVLQYVITARNLSGTDASVQALAEQRLLGFVARALHDFPVINDGTQIGANPPILSGTSLDGDDNEIQILFRPVGVEELVNFWSAEQQLTARLSLFYEVRVILLDTPPLPAAPGIVLSLGNYVFASEGPRLTSIRNAVGFLPPPGFGTIDPSSPFMLVPSDPARVALFGAAPPPSVHPENNHVVLEGEAFAGTRVLLALVGPAVISAEPLAERSYRLDLTRPGDNPSWNIAVSAIRIDLDLQQSATDDQGRPVQLFPGLHRASIVSATQAPGDQTGRFVERSSNEIWFAVSPQVVDVALNGGAPNARSYSLQLLGSYLSGDLEVSLSVGGRRLIRGTTPLDPGRFDFTNGTGQVDFVIDTTGETSPLPVNLRVNGAEATPAWAVF